MDDVRNLIARLKNRGVELSGDNAVAEMILDFNHELPRNVSSVHRSVRRDTGVVLVTGGHTRAMLDSFPEVLQMDCTHKTNQYAYQLLTIVGMDQYSLCTSC
ncbi:hypothetical protein PC114_g19056 [Phytophthora cactorum]|uniref:ZSWIM1/3 RNaseH-like domain-containing protein n=1 Tax=Phytophthora cactorum TaxID=29920 RepID=A0A8T1C0R7_9STRA|nr:hypothetical protein PC114_g19056 [Phytophthora cactorum]KAG2913613.1 hypothetical protein PC117_g18525 [Phytophthora cactorum]KAG3142370.1 hypothetical protein C6341_g19466 [Phytophthora cactorum]